ncbi:MAG: isochorismatase family protein [Desulfarculaceae bacterium]|nr:isochorismatase family protein [Desulfarculaceae bacterium]MCF8073879.1 isochorismatase family protein [Desulfarculaceae bacterium]MCF8102859.1 isochorismatase family protein [Desulfarculaceae bacterium]MCF8116303.1 isochorismatase family protein [Desulfarculaceae bacterium]
MERDLRHAPSLLRRGNSLLVIIDMQAKLVPIMHGKERLVANLSRLARFAGIVGLPVVVTEQKNLGPTIDEVASVLPQGTETIEKIAFDCFGCAPFQEKLWENDRPNLVFAGIESHICVAQTALSGLAGHGVHVISDAVASRREENRQVALGRLQQAGAVISSVEMFMYELLRQAGTDEFRQVLPLVKEDL